MTEKQAKTIAQIKNEITWPSNLPKMGEDVKNAINSIDNVWFWINIAADTYAKSGIELIMAAAKGELMVNLDGEKMKAHKDGKIEVKK